MFSNRYKMIITISMCLMTTTSFGKKAFVDKTVELGLSGMGGSGCAWGDINNDGYTDLYDGGKIWLNDNGKKFTAAKGYGWGILGDYDNDGYMDIFVISGSSFVMHSQSGTEFKKVQLPTLPTPDNRGACWVDLNNDGYLDLYVSGYETGGYQPDVVLTNKKGTSFEMSWQEPPVLPDKVLFPGRGVTACDFDEDGDIDVYVSNYRLEANYLWLNNGKGDIKDVAIDYGVGGTYESWRYSYGHTIGSAWGDMDNDGHIDLFVGNFSHPPIWQDRPKFYRNLGSVGNWHFEEKWELTGDAWEESYASPALGDYDNDGDMDLYFTTVYNGDNARLWRNDGNWKFTDVTDSEGLGSMPPTYQAAWADFDNDGDLDLTTGGRVYVNTGNANSWLKVNLRGDGNTINRTAIGCQVRIKLSDDIVLTRQVEAGTGEGNQNEPTLHFGLGKYSDTIDVEIFWAKDTSQKLQNIKPNRLVTVEFDKKNFND